MDWVNGPPPTWTEWIRVLSDISLIFAAAGVVFLFWQTRAARGVARTAAHAALVQMGDSVNDMFIEHPDLANALFDNDQQQAIPAKITAEQRANPKRLFAAMKILDYFELVLEEKKSIPDALQESLEKFMKERFALSTYLRRLAIESGWYGKDLAALARASAPGAR